MEKIWKIQSRKCEDIIDQLLLNRKIISDSSEKEEKERFLTPDFYRDLHDPFLMGGVKKAAERIKQAYQQKETIGIFADYDADGIPGAALFYRALKKIGIKSIVYIPNREGGYGLSEEGIEYLISKKCTLVVTIDLGIRNIAEAEYCKKKNLDLIITDHHLPGSELPDCFALINPKIKNDSYPFKELSGCGVAFKITQALSKYFSEINETFLKWNLDLVAISTIADVVPLIGENRVLAKYGLMVLQKSKNLGICEMCKTAGINKDSIDAYITGFQIAPRINAPGRIDHATKSLEILIADDLEEAHELALWLNEKNEIRQAEMKKTEAIAIRKILDNKLDEENIIVVAGKWLKGIIGPTASKLVEKFYRPVILFSEDDEQYVGSARSVEAVNIVELFEMTKEFTKKFGGHKGAAGITVLRKNFDKFLKLLYKNARLIINPNDLICKIKIDGEIYADEINFGIIKEVKKLEPFGLGNPRPIFMMTNVFLGSVKRLGAAKNHLAFNVRKDGKVFNAIYFNADFDEDLVNSNQFFDIAFNINEEHWNGRNYLKLVISDVKVAQGING